MAKRELRRRGGGLWNDRQALYARAIRLLDEGGEAFVGRKDNRRGLHVSRGEATPHVIAAQRRAQASRRRRALRRPFALLLLAALLPTLTACDTLMYEKQAFVLCMAIDQSAGGIRLTLQLPEGGGEASGASQGASGYSIVSVSAEGLEAALTLAEASEPYPLHYGQLRLIVFGGAPAAEGGLRAMLEVLSQQRGMRPTATVAVALGAGADVLAMQKPELNLRLSKHIDVTLRALRSQGLIPTSTLTEVLRELSQKRGDPLVALCAVNPALTKDGKQQGGDSSGAGDSGGSGGSAGGASSAAFAALAKSDGTHASGDTGDGTCASGDGTRASGEMVAAAFSSGEGQGGEDRGAGASFAGGMTDDGSADSDVDQSLTSGAQTPADLLADNLQAGGLPRDGGNPVEFMGAVALGQDRAKATLSARETELVSLMASRCVLRCAIDGEELQLQVLAPAELMPLAGEMDALLGKLQGAECDALGFAKKAARAFWTDAEWRAYDFAQRYPRATRYVGGR